jgi:hypothetical protein
MSLRRWSVCVLLVSAGCATGADATRTEAEPENAPEVAPKKKTPVATHAEPASEEDAPPVAARKEEPAKAATDASTDEPPPGAAEAPKRTSADPFGDVGFKEVNQKDWVAGLRETISRQETVPPVDLRVSPGLLRAAYVRSPVVVTKPGRRPVPRRHEIVVVDNQGRRVATFRAVVAKRGDEPPKDLRFLSEERLVYEVVEPPPDAEPPAKLVAHKRPHAKATKKPTPAVPRIAVTPLPPPRTFVIQPIAQRARAIKCVGAHFTFTHDKDRLAFVSGTTQSAFISVDGAQVYPRRGRTIVASAPAWSKDGRSLAFLEARAERPARLVLLAELDNPTGDTTWDLPPTATTEGALVFWAGSSKLVVGKTQMRPVFSASFSKEMPGR